MYLHHKAKLVYLAHPRTASCSTADALKKRGFEMQATHHLRLTDPESPFVGAEALDVDDWLVFSSVRNHWDTMVSWMAAACHENPTGPWTVAEIERFTGSNPYIQPNTLWQYHPWANEYLRYEQLQSGLDQILTMYGVEPVPLDNINPSTRRQGRSYRELLTPEAVDYIGTRFRDEIEVLGYVA